MLNEREGWKGFPTSGLESLAGWRRNSNDGYKEI
jgi:hypothetical protein